MERTDNGLLLKSSKLKVSFECNPIQYAQLIRLSFVFFTTIGIDSLLGVLIFRLEDNLNF